MDELESDETEELTFSDVVAILFFGGFGGICVISSIIVILAHCKNVNGRAHTTGTHMITAETTINTEDPFFQETLPPSDQIESGRELVESVT